MSKLKILCLHGYRQNEHIFREKTGALRKLLKGKGDFVFVSAPHVIPEEDNLKRSLEQRERGWWFSRTNNSYNALDETDISTGYEESVSFVLEMLERDGPFDGILGFSQGASFLSLLIHLQQTKPQLFELKNFKFAIFVSGFKSSITTHQHCYSIPLELPSFHIMGSGDQVIPPVSSEHLSQHFTSPTLYQHAGGHYVPANPELRDKLRTFLSQFLS